MHMQMDPITGQPGEYLVLSIPPEVIQAALQQPAGQMGLAQAGAPGFAAGALPYIINNQAYGLGPIPYPHQQMYNAHNPAQQAALQPLLIQGHVAAPPQQVIGQQPQQVQLQGQPVYNLQPIQQPTPTGPHVPAFQPPLYGPQNFGAAQALAAAAPQQQHQVLAGVHPHLTPQGPASLNALGQPQYVYSLHPIQGNVHGGQPGMPVHGALQPANVHPICAVQPQMSPTNPSRYQAVLQPVAQAGLQPLGQAVVQPVVQPVLQPMAQSPQFLGQFIAEPGPGFGVPFFQPCALPHNAPTDKGLHGGDPSAPKRKLAGPARPQCVPCSSCKENHPHLLKRQST